VRPVRLGILFLISAFVASAAQAQWPYVPIVQSNSKSQNSASITCAFKSDVTSADYGFMLMNWEGTTNTPTISDAITSTYTQKLINTSNTVKIAVYTTTFGSSGANTVTMAVTSGTFMNITCIEFPPLWTLTVDASAVSTFSGTPATVTSPSITTTLNSDLIFAFANNDNSAGGQRLQTASLGTWYQPSSVGGADSLSSFFRIGGVAAAGNQVTLTNKGTLGTLVSIAFKSNSIAVTSRATAPDGATSNAYDWTVLGAGGSGAYTWSVTSGALPTGLSINSGTGEITGTPTVANNYTATIQVSDGTNTASQAIAFKIASALNTISLVQGKSAATDTGSTSITFASNVTIGNAIILELCYNCELNEIQLCTDSLGTSFKNYVIYPYNPAGSSNALGMIQIQAGIAPATGADTVSCGLPASGGALMSVGEFSNINFLAMDNIVATQGANASPATITTGTLTTLVPNELLYGSCGSYTAVGASSTINSPFTRVGNTTWPQTEGYQVVTTVTGYTMSCAQTGNTNTGWLMALMGLRPSGGSVIPPSARRRSHMIL
jgi:hypothetical protein